MNEINVVNEMNCYDDGANKQIIVLKITSHAGILQRSPISWRTCQSHVSLALPAVQSVSVLT